MARYYYGHWVPDEGDAVEVQKGARISRYGDTVYWYVPRAYTVRIDTVYLYIPAVSHTQVAWRSRKGELHVAHLAAIVPSPSPEELLSRVKLESVGGGAG